MLQIWVFYFFSSQFWDVIFFWKVVHFKFTDIKLFIVLAYYFFKFWIIYSCALFNYSCCVFVPSLVFYLGQSCQKFVCFIILFKEWISGFSSHPVVFLYSSSFISTLSFIVSLVVFCFAFGGEDLFCCSFANC